MRLALHETPEHSKVRVRRGELTDEQFLELCRANPAWRIERTEGEAESASPGHQDYELAIHREFFAFCEENPDLRIELTAEGQIEVMPPTGSETGRRNIEIGAQLHIWTKKDGRGRGYDSSTGFRLLNRAVRSPDACWVARSRIEAFTRRQRELALPICPDFVIELTSPSDRIRHVQAKMREYIENGAQLGWLIHAKARTAYIYRPDQAVEKLIAPVRLIGESPVNGFVLELAEVWDPDSERRSS